MTITAAVWIGFIGSFSIHRYTPIPAWKQLFDIGAEANIPTWWNSLLLAFVAGAMAFAASIDREAEGRRRRAWLVGASAAIYLSLDEAAALHERLDSVATWLGIDSGTYGWVLPGLALASVGVAILLWVGRSLPAPLRHQLLLALAVYGLGALGFEAFGGSTDNSTLFTLGIAVEEGLEMMACIGAAVAVLDSIGVERLADSTKVWLSDSPSATTQYNDDC